MKHNQQKIIRAPILSLSAKIELFAKFLRKAAPGISSDKKNCFTKGSDSPLKQTVKQVAAKKISNTGVSLKKKKTA